MSLDGERTLGRDRERDFDLDPASQSVALLSVPALLERGTAESDSLPVAFEQRRAKVRLTRGAMNDGLVPLDLSIEARENCELFVL